MTRHKSGSNKITTIPRRAQDNLQRLRNQLKAIAVTSDKASLLNPQIELAAEWKLVLWWSTFQMEHQCLSITLALFACRPLQIFFFRLNVCLHFRFDSQTSINHCKIYQPSNYEWPVTNWTKLSANQLNGHLGWPVGVNRSGRKQAIVPLCSAYVWLKQWSCATLKISFFFRFNFFCFHLRKKTALSKKLFEMLALLGGVVGTVKPQIASELFSVDYTSLFFSAGI